MRELDIAMVEGKRIIVISHITWILRKFADSWNGSGEAENAPLLTKQIETFSTVELLFNISELA